MRRRLRLSLAPEINHLSLIVDHSSEIDFVYGVPPDPSASAVHLSSIMIDYWVSFATSLDPNDGHGNPRKYRYYIALDTCTQLPTTGRSVMA